MSNVISTPATQKQAPCTKLWCKLCFYAITDAAVKTTLGWYCSAEDAAFRPLERTVGLKLNRAARMVLGLTIVNEAAFTLGATFILAPIDQHTKASLVKAAVFGFTAIYGLAACSYYTLDQRMKQANVPRRAHSIWTGMPNYPEVHMVFMTFMMGGTALWFKGLFTKLAAALPVMVLFLLVSHSVVGDALRTACEMEERARMLQEKADELAAQREEMLRCNCVRCLEEEDGEYASEDGDYEESDAGDEAADDEAREDMNEDENDVDADNDVEEESDCDEDDHRKDSTLTGLDTESLNTTPVRPLEEVNRENQRLHDRLRNLEASLRTTEQDRDDYRKDLAKLRERHADRIDDMEKQQSSVERLNEEIDELNATVERRDGIIDNLESRIRWLIRDLHDARADSVASSRQKDERGRDAAMEKSLKAIEEVRHQAEIRRRESSKKAVEEDSHSWWQEWVKMSQFAIKYETQAKEQERTISQLNTSLDNAKRRIDIALSHWREDSLKHFKYLEELGLAWTQREEHFKSQLAEATINAMRFSAQLTDAGTRVQELNEKVLRMEGFLQARDDTIKRMYRYLVEAEENRNRQSNERFRRHQRLLGNPSPSTKPFFDDICRKCDQYTQEHCQAARHSRRVPSLPMADQEYRIYGDVQHIQYVELEATPLSSKDRAPRNASHQDSAVDVEQVEESNHEVANTRDQAECHCSGDFDCNREDCLYRPYLKLLPVNDDADNGWRTIGWDENPMMQLQYVCVGPWECVRPDCFCGRPCNPPSDSMRDPLLDEESSGYESEVEDDSEMCRDRDLGSDSDESSSEFAWDPLAGGSDGCISEDEESIAGDVRPSPGIWKESIALLQCVRSTKPDPHASSPAPGPCAPCNVPLPGDEWDESDVEIITSRESSLCGDCLSGSDDGYGMESEGFVHVSDMSDEEAELYL